MRHQIDRPVPVQSLIKCRMQDNLEFLQWIKRHWDQYYPGGEYDAVARRKGSGAPPPAAGGARSGTSSATGTRRGTTPTSAAGRARVGGANNLALTQELNAQKEAIAGLEKERDFYFAKLRDIELLLQQAVETDPELEKGDDSLVKHIQAILYSTEVLPPIHVLKAVDHPLISILTIELGGIRDSRWRGWRRGIGDILNCIPHTQHILHLHLRLSILKEDRL